MANKISQSLTLANIGKLIDQKLAPVTKDISAIRTDITGVKVDITGLKVKASTIKYDMKTGFDDLKEKTNHLPTKDEYYKREDKTMGELKKLREAVTVTGYHYKNTNKRIDKIDKHLNINTSIVF